MKGIRLIAGLAALGAAAVLHAGATGAASEYTAVPGQPLVSYSRWNGMVVEEPAVPLVRIYGDGVVRVHRPRHMRDPGDFEMRLDAAALARLVSSLDGYGVMSFDAEAVKRQRGDIQARRRSERTEHVVSDPTITTIALRFAAYRGTSLDLTVRWADVGIDARRYPELQPILNLAAAETELGALVRHPDLERVGPAKTLAGAVR